MSPTFFYIVAGMSLDVLFLPFVGGMDPRCKICIFMGKTDPEAPKHKQQVLILRYCLVGNRNVAFHEKKKMRHSCL